VFIVRERFLKTEQWTFVTDAEEVFGEIRCSNIFYRVQMNRWLRGILSLAESVSVNYSEMWGFKIKV
jgi:hypothetical protein